MTGLWWSGRFVALVFAIATLVAGCDSAESGDTTLTGVVVDSETGDPIASAFVRFVPPDEELVETDAEGRYSYTFDIDSTTVIRVTATRDGYLSSPTIQVTAVADRVIEVPTLRLTRILGEDISGKASNIQLVGATPSTIGIRESGAPEISRIRFVVVDSTGDPITLDNAVDVAFRFGNRPGGDEFLGPEVDRTDVNGQVEVNVSSGFQAGTIQVLASAVVDGRTIQSLPVTLVVHGGFPDQTHFSIGPARFNFPGLRLFGLTNAVSVIVGDKHSNPVKPGTKVYFKSSHAVVQGSIDTDTDGRGTVNVISANPLPGDGIALITASTADELEEPVTGSTPMVFSGFPVVTVTPTIALLDQVYQLTVTDQNGNPLVGGTTIRVTAEGTNVKATGNVDVELDDTVFLGGVGYNNVVRGRGITEFTFVTASDVPDEGENPQEPELAAITIQVQGENGRVEVVLTPEGQAQVLSEGTTFELRGNSAIFSGGDIVEN